jgi:hypothetical protein
MKNLYINVGVFVLGFFVCFILMSSHKTTLPVIHAGETGGIAGNNTVVVTKIGNMDAAVILDSQTKTLLIYKIIAGSPGTIEFVAARKFETDLMCEKYGNTRPEIAEIKKKCEEKKQ